MSLTQLQLRNVGASSTDMVDDTNPLPVKLVSDQPVNGSPLTNRSGAIVSGASAQEACPDNGSRRYLLIQNKSANADTLWIAFGKSAEADSPSIEMPPNSGLIFDGSFCPTDSVSIIAATTGTKFTIWEG